MTSWSYYPTHLSPAGVRWSLVNNLKYKTHLLLILMSLKTCMNLFLLQNTTFSILFLSHCLWSNPNRLMQAL